MIYTVSDIHGRYDKYQKLLEQIDLGPDDTLYVLGDVLDRGPEGFKILLDIARRPNVMCLTGNHEAMAMAALPGLLSARYRQTELDGEAADAAELWFYNGGERSLKDFLELDTEQMRAAWDYMRAMPLYREVEAGGRRFVLVHGGLGNFFPDRPLEDYQPRELYWSRPKLDTVYYANKLVVLGHTPVQSLRRKTWLPGGPAKIIRTDSFCDIDCGCVFPGGRLGCLCLDTMEEFYI